LPSDSLLTSSNEYIQEKNINRNILKQPVAIGLQAGRRALEFVYEKL
jgi:hypothetical protein